MHQERAGELFGQAAAKAPKTSGWRLIYQLARISVGTLARWPDLGALAAVLGLDAGLSVPLLSAVDIAARLEYAALLQKTAWAYAHF